MRFLHVSDLHFGKNLDGLSLIDNQDQPVWVERFLKQVKQLKPDAIVIAGDVYDRSNPSAEAVDLLDHMISGLHELGTEVMMISGNHDSGPRLAFASGLLGMQKVHIAGRVTAKLQCVTLTDDYGAVHFWLLPYYFPAAVADAMEDDTITTYEDATQRLLSAQDINTAQRNVIILHQNVLANGKEAEHGGSETMVGGVGCIDYHAFDAFDYVAMGHIHAAHQMGRDTVRYAGSPLCYHFDETKFPHKGCLLITMEEKGKVTVEPVPIAPLHPMVELKGTLEEILEKIRGLKDAYLKCVLTDRYVTSQVSGPIRAEAASNGCRVIEFAHSFGVESTLFGGEQPDLPTIKGKGMDELFCEFYQVNQKNEPERADYELILKAVELAQADAAESKKAQLDENEKAGSQLAALAKKLEAAE